MPKLVSVKQESCADCRGMNLELFNCSDSSSRFCAKCMIGHKVKVFWPVDERWYEGSVEEYNQAMGEHKLRYKDGDSEWVKIGEISSGTRPSPSSTIFRGTQEHGSSSGGGMEPKKHRSSPVEEDAALVARLGHGHHSHAHAHATTREALLSNSGSIYPTGGGMDGQQQHNNNMMFHPNGYHGVISTAGVGGGGVAAANTAGNNGASHASYPPMFGSHAYGPPMNPAGHPYAHLPYPPHAMVPDSAYSPHGGAPHYFAPNMTHHPPATSPTNRISPDKESPPKSGSPSKKNPPKTWSRQEDAQLLSLVQRMQIPVKWSYVAQNMEGRSGKQCRERYVNHLNPLLKHCDWSPIEDATIFHLYNTTGSQWATMSKMIPGRTDNGIKNRFHNLRRQLEREDEQRMRLSKSEDFPDEIRLDKIRVFPSHLRGKADHCWDVFESLGVLAAQSVLGGGLARNASRFGPFRKASETGEQCSRCGLYAPSRQCGTEICTKSNWCIACTRVPPHLCSNVLRECLNLRRVAGAKENEMQRTDTESMLKRGALVIAQD